jgi:hypothetical protein
MATFPDPEILLNRVRLDYATDSSLNLKYSRIEITVGMKESRLMYLIACLGGLVAGALYKR